MNPLTESQIRSSFVNASKGDAKRASLPDLAQVRWDQLDYLGWQDAKRPRLHYVALEVDGFVACLLLRGNDTSPTRKMLCAWCEDVIDGLHAASFVAPLAGDSGRRGNSIGTAICADFRCSKNVRRAPTPVEIRTEDPALLEYYREQKIAGLQERSAAFVRSVRTR
ncbi:FBP domain-containing protein [Brachybacterium sp. GCM10030267]|uniref:FBP domain-containing protein n=1 Tax=unclassified Brachybacterium TaxID=2623841 RepID=UPI00361A7E50